MTRRRGAISLATPVLFERAIALDPAYARAYAGLAAVYWDISNLGWYWELDLEWKSTLEQAKANLEKGMEQPAREALALSAERHSYLLGKSCLSDLACPEDGNHRKIL